MIGLGSDKNTFGQTKSKSCHKNTNCHAQKSHRHTIYTFWQLEKKRVCPVTWALRRVSWAQMKSWTMNIFNSFGFRLSQKNSTIGWLDVRVQTTAFPLTHFRDWWSNVLLSLGILGIHFDVSEHLKESFWQHGSEYFCEELFKSTYIGFLELHKTDI